MKSFSTSYLFYYRHIFCNVLTFLSLQTDQDLKQEQYLEQNIQSSQEKQSKMKHKTKKKGEKYLFLLVSLQITFAFSLIWK